MNRVRDRKLGWIEISSRKYGGKAYEELVKKILTRNFDLEVINIETKYFKRGYLKIPELLFTLLRMRGEKDLWIREFYSIPALSLNRTQGKNLAIIHHIDFSQSSFLSKPINLLIEKLIYHNLKKIDYIVTVSQYWQNHFLEKGYPNVYTIHNCFDLAEYNISEKESTEFKKKYRLEDKPIIYIGNCQRAKGVIESYQALKDLDVYFVTSGEPFVRIPARNLEIEYKDYLKLLKASSLVITMSKFKEGWCRTIHEAMLLKTPVIGSGLGGMKELLEGGKQIICPNFNQLRKKVEYLLNNPAEREKMGEAGFNFAKNFTLEKFEKEWLDLIKKII